MISISEARISVTDVPCFECEADIGEYCRLGFVHHSKPANGAHVGRWELQNRVAYTLGYLDKDKVVTDVERPQRGYPTHQEMRKLGDTHDLGKILRRFLADGAEYYSELKLDSRKPVFVLDGRIELSNAEATLITRVLGSERDADGTAYLPGDTGRERAMCEPVAGAGGRNTFAIGRVELGNHAYAYECKTCYVLFASEVAGNKHVAKPHSVPTDDYYAYDIDDVRRARR